MGTRHRPHSARSCELVLRAVGAARGRSGGVTSCRGVGRPGLGALRRPTAGLRGVRPGPATHWLWMRGVWAWGPVTNPTARAPASWLCALWVRHEGPRGEGGGAVCQGVARPGLGALPRPTARPWGVRPGPATHLLCVRGPWAWGPVTNPTASAFASWLCALWGGTRAPGGRAPFAGVWGVRGWALFLARLPGLEACGRGPLPTGCGCGGCGRGEPSPTPQRALLRAGFARCCGGTRAPGDGSSCLHVGRPGWGAVSRPTAHSWGVRPGPATHWLWVRRVWACRAVTNPIACALGSSLCTLWRRYEGARTRGASRLVTGASGVGRSPTPDRLYVGHATGARYPLAVGAGAVGMGTRHQPDSVRSCELAFRAVGAAGGRPGQGAPVAWVSVVRGWALSHAGLPVLGACGRGPLPTGCRSGECEHGDPSPTPQRALLRAGLACFGSGTRAPGGWGASCLGVGRPGSGALPCPKAYIWGVRPGPAIHWLWVQGVWARGPVTYRTARALGRWLCPLWGRHEGARGGGASCMGVERPGLGALPRPTARPWGVQPGPATHRLWVRGVWA